MTFEQMEQFTFFQLESFKFYELEVIYAIFDRILSDVTNKTAKGLMNYTDLNRLEGNIETEYEHKFAALGQPIYRLEAYLPEGAL